MHSFFINIHTVQQVQEFIDLACGFPFEITISDGRRSFNGKSLMGYFCLDSAHPLKVQTNCSDEDFRKFHTAVRHLCTR